MNPGRPYRGRLAPSPTGYLHLGHARTFWQAQERARIGGGVLILRNEDLDAARCKPEFVEAMFEDLRWFGLRWSEGPDVGGDFGPYQQSERMGLYVAALARLREKDSIYPCTCSRRDIQAAVTAPHAADDEVIYPGTCRPKSGPGQEAGGREGAPTIDLDALCPNPPGGWRRGGTGGETPPLPAAGDGRATGGRQSALAPSWRFRVPAGEVISFTDQNLGSQSFVAGRDFGDFVVWRGDDVPAYQLACVVDDAAMGITEVVRGADLLVSTARQLLLYRVLDLASPDFFHCALLRDETGQRLAKRHAALSLRQLRARGVRPAELRAGGRP